MEKSQNNTKKEWPIGPPPLSIYHLSYLELPTVFLDFRSLVKIAGEYIRSL